MTDRTCSEDGCGKPVRARGRCASHWTLWRRAQGDDFVSLYGDPVARFWLHVTERGPDECWPWEANIEPSGYGTFQTTYQGVRFTKAHRFAYHILVKPVPPELDLDHLCHTRDESCRAGDDCPHRRCCNPAHLEPVTEQINTLRSRSSAAEYASRTKCDYGHDLSGGNLIVRPNGARRCRECKNASARRSYAAKKQPLSDAA